VIGKLFRNLLAVKAILLVLTFGIFSAVLTKKYANWDDRWMVYENPQVYNLHLHNLKSYFTEFYSGQYSPVNTLYYGLIYFFFKLSPISFHFFSLILHVVNVYLVYQFIKELLNAGWRVRSFTSVEPHSFPLVAFATAFLFGISPIQVEAVAWISASKILLYSTFYLASLIFYLKFLENKRIKQYLYSIIFFLLSLGAKEQAVMLPFSLLLIDLFLSRRLSFRLWLEKTPFFLLSLSLGIITILEQNSAFESLLKEEYYPFWQRLLLSTFSIIEYLIKIYLPVNLSKFYSFPMEPGGTFPLKYWLYPIFVIILTFSSYYSIKRNQKHILFGIVFFVLNIVLALHIFPMARRAFLADRYVYLSCIGCFFILVIEVLKLYNKLSKTSQRNLLVLCILYVAALISYSVWHSIKW
jgi:hypothetical protein